MSAEKHKILLFGGSFDPIHLGHTAVANSAREVLKAAKVVFIPARRSPHKDNMPHASDEARIKMIRLAIADNPTFAVNYCELNRALPSYTIDTVMEMRGKFGRDSEICWLLGADAAAGLARWYRVNDLLDMCTICIMPRPGFQIDISGLEPAIGGERIEKLKRNMIQTPLVPISSTEIRNRLFNGQSTDGLLHPDVIKFIMENDVYRKIDEES